MGATQDSELLKETLDFITNKSRDQDIMYFFRGLGANVKAKRMLANFFKEQYDVVRREWTFEFWPGLIAWQLYKRFEGNFMLKYLVEVNIQRYS